MKLSTPKFVQGIQQFSGAGYGSAAALDSYTVSEDKRAQLVYFRAGNSSEAMIVLSLTCDGTLMRYFPIGAQSSEHVSLAVVEDIHPGSEIIVSVAAPPGISGTVVFDFGLVEI